MEAGGENLTGIEERVSLVGPGVNDAPELPF